MTQLTDRQLEKMFEDMVDECTPIIEIGMLKYLASDVLKRIDPVAYREGLWEHMNWLIAKEAIFEHSDGSYHDEPESDD